MILEFLPEASAELFEAADYYESKQEGLGRRFRNEVLEVCGLIVQQPLLWRERAGGYRRVNCPVFPYYIAYFIRGDLIVVAAVAHGHRRPGYWKQRLSPK
jgi:plasmid stabilization system protein ParE